MPDHLYYTKNRERLIEYQKNYYQNNKERYTSKRREKYKSDPEKERINAREWRELNPSYGQLFRKKSKEEFLKMYGNVCSCCGESEVEFLTIEHKNGQKGISSTQKRKSSKAYRDAVKEYRPDLYEVLCMNCNHAKGKLGYCPHQINQNKIGEE